MKFIKLFLSINVNCYLINRPLSHSSEVSPPAVHLSISKSGIHLNECKPFHQNLPTKSSIPRVQAKIRPTKLGS